MDMKDPGALLLAGVLGLGGGSLSSLIDLGSLREKVEHCEKVNAVQWQKVNLVEERVARLEAQLPP